MPSAERKRIVEACRSGDLRVLSNVYLVTEGFDAPRVKCVMLLRPFTNRSARVMLPQMVGRAVNRDGNQLGDFKDSWWEALSEAGIKDFHFHDLRHTFATDMISSGAQDLTVQEALGHAHMKTTAIYAHIKNEYLRGALETVSEKNKQ